MKHVFSTITLLFALSFFGCSEDTQVPIRQQPKAMLCHVRGVPNACYVFTPKSIDLSVFNSVIVYTLTDDDGQETKIFGMDCLIMPRDAIGDGACLE